MCSWRVDGEVEKIIWNHLRPEQLLVRGRVGGNGGKGERGDRLKGKGVRIRERKR